MNPVGKLAAYGVVLGLALGGGAAIGAAVGPVDVDDVDDVVDDDGEDGHGVHDPASEAAGAPDDLPGGVLLSQAGYTIEPETRQLEGSAGAPFRFRITGPGGEVVRRFEPRHERELHLIVAGTDLGSFAHLHPARASDGSWSVDLPALRPGTYRAVADFAPAGGPDLALGVDLVVAGSYAPRPLPPATATAVVDGYEVTLARTPMAGSSSEVVLTVTRDDEPVDDLEPYLGASGHLVAFRAGDLAYLHVHPLADDGAGGGPTVRFAVELPSSGEYRLFFEFAHGGVVRTAAFTIEVGTVDDAPAPPADDHGDSSGEEHE